MWAYYMDRLSSELLYPLYELRGDVRSLTLPTSRVEEYRERIPTVAIGAIKLWPTPFGTGTGIC